MSKRTSVIITLCAAVAIFLLGMFVGKRISKPATALSPDVRVTTSIDTSKVLKPQETATIPQGYLSVPVVETASVGSTYKQTLPSDGILLIPTSGTEVSDTAHLPRDTLRRALIPIEQKVYSDSNYTAYISGYRPTLDSIFVYNRTRTIEYTKSVTKFRRWNVGITGGYGFGFVSHRLEPFVGIGVTYNIFK